MSFHDIFDDPRGDTEGHEGVRCFYCNTSGLHWEEGYRGRVSLFDEECIEHVCEAPQRHVAPSASTDDFSNLT